MHRLLDNVLIAQKLIYKQVLQLEHKILSLDEASTVHYSLIILKFQHSEP